MTGELRKQHNEELHGVLCSSNNAKVINQLRRDG
jgi:hypothetical protein